MPAVVSNSGAHAPDGAAWDNQDSQRQTTGRRHSSRGRQEGDTWGGAAANDWNPSSSSHGQVHVQRSSTTRGRSTQRDRNAAYYDTGHFTPQRGLNTTQVYGYPYANAYGAPPVFNYWPHRTRLGWGNDDIYDEEFDVRSDRSRRHSSRRDRDRGGGGDAGGNRADANGWGTQVQGGEDNQAASWGDNTGNNVTTWDYNNGGGQDNGGWGSSGDGEGHTGNNGSTPAWDSGGNNYNGDGDAGWGQANEGWGQANGGWVQENGGWGGDNDGGSGAGWGGGNAGAGGWENNTAGFGRNNGSENGSSSTKTYRIRRSPERKSSYPYKTMAKFGPIPVEEIPPGAVERFVSESGPGIKNLFKSFITGSGLHPFLRPASLLKSQTFLWDIRRIPHPGKSGLPIGEAVGGFHEPATKPARPFMRIKIPIPGLGGAHWSVDVTPKSPQEMAEPIIPFTFLGSPTSFGRSRSKRSKYESDSGYYSTYIRVGDVLMRIYWLLQQRATRVDYGALSAFQQQRVNQAFFDRCKEIEGPDGRVKLHQQGPGTEEIDREIQKKIRQGLKRIDFMVGKTRWAGLDSDKDPDTWILRLRTSG